MHKSLFLGLLITSFMFSISMPAQSVEDWPRIKTVTELMDEASELYDAGDISGAIALYDEAWEGDTAYCRSLIGKSYLLYIDDRYPESISAAYAALERCPK